MSLGHCFFREVLSRADEAVHRLLVDANTESSGPDKVVWPSLAMPSLYVYMYVSAPTVILNSRLNRSVWVEGLTLDHVPPSK